MRLHSSGCSPSLFPPLRLLQAVLQSKCLIFSGSFYTWGFLGPPVAAATIREGAYYTGHRNGSEWVKIGGCLFLVSVPMVLSLLCVSSQGIPDPLPARREKSVQGIHRLESFRSKSCLISLLTRFQGCDWHGARWQRPSNAQQGGQAQ